MTELDFIYHVKRARNLRGIKRVVGFILGKFEAIRGFMAII